MAKSFFLVVVSILSLACNDNQIKYNEAGKADFVNPNLDVAYMEAWFAIDENSAVLIEIPKDHVI